IDYLKVPTRPFPECWEQFDYGLHNLDKFRLLPHIAQIGVLALGHPETEARFDWPTLERILSLTHPPYLSTHLEARAEYFPEIMEYQHQNHTSVRRALTTHFNRVIREVKEKLGIVFVLENLPYYSWWRHFRYGSEPEFITEICETNDCGFLLDIAHARCSASHLNLDLVEYIEALPLHRLREIHLAGVRERTEGIRDAHTALTEEDYQLAEYLLQKTDPEIITIEYGGLPDRIWNVKGEYEPISRNCPRELETILIRVGAMIRRGKPIATLIEPPG
ncbi:MAG TPA: DUF692 family protein, partial [Bacillota bacterium]|nr:DUF692 family protein [Bacillota bacterium]